MAEIIDLSIPQRKKKKSGAGLASLAGGTATALDKGGGGIADAFKGKKGLLQGGTIKKLFSPREDKEGDKKKKPSPDKKGGGAVQQQRARAMNIRRS